MTTCAWLWLYAGAFLMLAELLAPGFVIFFFGLSAATVGLVRFALGDAFSATWQLVAFSVFTILYLAVLRRLMKNLFTGASEASATDFENDSVGRTGKVTVAIEPPQSGRVLLGDAEWTAEAPCAIAAGTFVRVVSRRNLTMTVEPLDGKDAQ